MALAVASSPEISGCQRPWSRLKRNVTHAVQQESKIQNLNLDEATRREFMLGISICIMILCISNGGKCSYCGERLTSFTGIEDIPSPISVSVEAELHDRSQSPCNNQVSMNKSDMLILDF